MRQRTRSTCRNMHPGRITIATCRAISSAIAPTGQPGSSIAGHIGAALWVKSAGPIVIRAAGIRAQWGRMLQESVANERIDLVGTPVFPWSGLTVELATAARPRAIGSGRGNGNGASPLGPGRGLPARLLWIAGIRCAYLLVLFDIEQTGGSCCHKIQNSSMVMGRRTGGFHE